MGGSPPRVRALHMSKNRVLQGFVVFFTSAIIFCLVPLLLWYPPSQQPIQSDPKTPPIKILIGIITSAARFERRSLLRLAYSLQPPPISAHVSIRFVLGKPKSKEESDLVSLETLRFNDIIQLDCEENMNQGKTFSYFSTVPSLGVRYDYVMKADDDAYIRLENLGHSLLLHPREDLYYGLPLPNFPYYGYMAGEGYVVSWDSVEWIAESPIPRNMSSGKEDELLKIWFNAGKKAKHRTNMKHLFYDHPEYGGQHAHGFIPETILIHQLKSLSRWMDVLAYFELKDNRNSSIA